MSEVCSEIDIAATPARVWEILMDPHRLGDWVTIHRRVDDAPATLRRGSTFRQTLNLRGAPLHVTWRVVDLDPPYRAVWEGRGPAHSQASIVYALSDDGHGHTRFEYTNEFRPPGGPFGAVAGRVLVGGLSQRETQRSLQRLKQLVESV
jgi:uncharacterized protein YndB with AHSA1/START domain